MKISVSVGFFYRGYTVSCAGSKACISKNHKLILVSRAPNRRGIERDIDDLIEREKAA